MASVTLSVDKGKHIVLIAMCSHSVLHLKNVKICCTDSINFSALSVYFSILYVFLVLCYHKLFRLMYNPSKYFYLAFSPWMESKVWRLSRGKVHVIEIALRSSILCLFFCHILESWVTNLTDKIMVILCGRVGWRENYHLITPVFNQLKKKRAVGQGVVKSNKALLGNGCGGFPLKHVTASIIRSKSGWMKWVGFLEARARIFSMLLEINSRGLKSFLSFLSFEVGDVNNINLWENQWTCESLF